MTNAPSSPQYTVSVWEGIAITAGALLLVAIGLAGLGVKALNNAFDPRRAEAIAQSMADYSIPGGSRGLFGANLGGGKLAVVTSTTVVQVSPALPPEIAPPPQAELFVARFPIPDSTTPSDSDETPVEDDLFLSGFSFSYQTQEAFQVTASHTENRVICGATVPVHVQEGTLTLAEGTAALPATRYEAKVKLNEENHLVIVSTLGKDSKADAAGVFASLRCK